MNNHEVMVTFSLGTQTISILLETNGDETDESLIHQALFMIDCEQNIVVEEICEKLHIDPYDISHVTIERKNERKESKYKIILCRVCDKELRVLAISKQECCTECEDYVFQ